MRRGKTITRICKNCGNTFEALMIKVRRGGGKFCSRSCYMKSRINTSSPEKNKFYKIKSVYGLTQIQYLVMLDECGHKCPICQSEFSQDNLPYIDHNHVTNVIRGLLCNSCNLGLGNFKDSADSLEKAIEYLNSRS